MFRFALAFKKCFDSDKHKVIFFTENIFICF